MDQLREHVKSVLDQQGVLARIKAELRASVFAAIHEQDTQQGGLGLGGKSNPAHRRQLAADASGELLVELVRECLQWCNLPFTLQVYEQEMQLGREGPTLANLQQRLGLTAAGQAAGPLLLQLLKAHQGHEAGVDAGQGLHATQAKPQPAGGLTAPPVPLADSGIAQPTWQLPSPRISSRGPGAGAAPAVSMTAAAPPPPAAGADERLSLSASVVADSSLIEESGLLESSARDEELCAAIFVPHAQGAIAGVTRGPDDSAGAGEQASLGGSSSNSSSSTSSVDTPRQLSRPVRGPALPALSAAAQGSHTAPVPTPAAAAPSVSDAGAACATFELSESFGERSSLADSSYELHGVDSPAAAAQPAALLKDPQSGSSTTSSRSLSRHGSDEPGADAVAAAAAPVAKPPPAALEPLPAWRAPGKLAPLPPLKPLGLAGLTVAAPPGDEAAPPLLQRPWASLGVRADLPQPAMVALAAEAAAAAAAAGGGAVSTAGASSRAAAGASPRAAAAASHASSRCSERGSEDEGDSDDFGAAGQQQQLFAAARRQLSQHAGGEGGTQQQQLGGAAGVLVTGTLEARLTMSSSSSSSGSSVDGPGGGAEAAFEDGDDDDGEGGLLMHEDIISLPGMGLGDADDDDHSGVFEAPPAAAHQHLGSQGGRRAQPLRQHSELFLTEEDTSEVPLASASGFAIEDDDF